MPESLPTIWDKIDLSQFASAADADETTEAGESEDKATRRRKRYFRLLDGLATIFWLYLIVKVFLGDLDLYFFRKVLPSAAWVVDYRFLILVFGLLVISLIFRKWFGLAVLYIAVFPLVVAVWKVPKLIYKRRDWNLAIGLIHVAVAGFYNHRYVLGFVGFGTLAAILVAAGDNPVVLVFSLVLSICLLLVGLYRGLRYAVVPSRFLRMQRNLIDRFVKSKFIEDHLTAADLKQADVQTFTKAQSDLLLQRVGYCVISHRLMYVWAYRIDEYRRSASVIVFSALSVVWLLALMVYCFTVANLSLYKLNHGQYSYTVTPSVVRFIYYSFASLYVNDISGLTAQGNGALILKIMAGLCGAILVLTLIVTLFLSYRQSKDDRVASQTIDDIRQRGKELEIRINSEFDVTLEEAIRRLQQFGFGLTSFIVLLTKQVPPDWW